MPNISVPPGGGGSATPSRTTSPSKSTRARPAWASASSKTPSSSGTIGPRARADQSSDASAPRPEHQEPQVVEVLAVDDLAGEVGPGEPLDLEAVGRPEDGAADHGGREAGLGPAGVDDLDAVAQRLGQRLQRADQAVRRDLGRAPAHDAGHRGPGPDDGDPLERLDDPRAGRRRSAAAPSPRPPPAAAGTGRRRTAVAAGSAVLARRGHRGGREPRAGGAPQRPGRPCRPDRRATASTSVAPSDRPGPGISRSSPAPSADTVSTMANQSVMTRPSNPHSSRRRSTSRADCSVSHRPFSRL